MARHENRQRLNLWQPCRLKAAVLALLFAALSLLPWAHVLTSHSHARHACCHHTCHEENAPDAGQTAVASQSEGHISACWICDGLATLLHHADIAGIAKSAGNATATPFCAQEPESPAIAHLYSANRSQAPPAAV